MINITFPDGAVREFESGVTTFEIAQSISNSLAKKALAGKFNGKLIDTTRAITEDGEEMLKRVLNILIHMDKNIEIGLPNYISGILKNIGGKGSKKANNINMTIFENVSKGKGLKSKNQIKQARKKGMEKISNIKEIMTENDFLEEKLEDKTLLLEKKAEVKNEKLDNVDEKIYNIEESNLEKILSFFDEETRNTIEEKALENIKKEIDNSNIDVILNVKKFSKTMYYKMIGTTVMEILKSEYFGQVYDLWLYKWQEFL